MIYRSEELNDMHAKMKAGTWRMYWKPHWPFLIGVVAVIAGLIALPFLI